MGVVSLKDSNSLGVISLVSVDAPTEVSGLTVKDAFYTKLESVYQADPPADELDVRVCYYPYC